MEQALPYTLEEQDKNGLMTSSRCECPHLSSHVMLTMVQIRTFVDKPECEGGGLVDQEKPSRTRAQKMAPLRRATFCSSRARPFESIKCFGQVATTCLRQRIAGSWQGLTLDGRLCPEDGPEIRQLGKF